MTGPERGDAVVACAPAEPETAGELDTPGTAMVGADADTAGAGTRGTAAACLAPKTAGGQPVCHPATTRAPPKRATATDAITGALNDHPRLASGAGSRVDGAARTFGGDGSRSRSWLLSPDSGAEEPWSEEPQFRQKCAKSLFRCPHAGHGRSPANVNAPPKPSVSKIRYVPRGTQWRIEPILQAFAGAWLADGLAPPAAAAGAGVPRGLRARRLARRRRAVPLRTRRLSWGSDKGRAAGAVFVAEIACQGACQRQPSAAGPREPPRPGVSGRARRASRTRQAGLRRWWPRRAGSAHPG